MYLQPVCGMHFNNNPRRDVKARVFTKCFCFCYCATRSMDVFPFWLFMSQPAECAALAVQPEGRLTCRTLRKERAHTLAHSYTLIHTLTHFQSYYKCTHARRGGAMQVQLLWSCNSCVISVIFLKQSCLNICCVCVRVCVRDDMLDVHWINRIKWRPRLLLKENL